MTGKDLVDEVVARIADQVAREIDRAASKQALRQVGPVLEDLKARASQAGPLGEAWAKKIDRTLAKLRRAAGRR